MAPLHLELLAHGRPSWVWLARTLGRAWALEAGTKPETHRAGAVDPGGSGEQRPEGSLPETTPAPRGTRVGDLPGDPRLRRSQHKRQENYCWLKFKRNSWYY